MLSCDGKVVTAAFTCAWFLKKAPWYLLCGGSDKSLGLQSYLLRRCGVSLQGLTTVPSEEALGDVGNGCWTCLLCAVRCDWPLERGAPKYFQKSEAL